MATTVSLVETLALFAILCAKVSPLWKQARVRQVRKTEAKVLQGLKMRQANLLFFFLFFAEGGEVKVRLRAGGGGGGVGSLGRLAEAAAAVLDDSAPVAGAA
jgi:hypothetical protein